MSSNDTHKRIKPSVTTIDQPPVPYRSSPTCTHPPALLRTPISILEIPSLYLCPLSAALDEHLLYKLQITHILSLLPTSTSIHSPPGVPYARAHHRINLPLPSEEGSEEDIDKALLAILPEATAWMEEVLKDRRAVLMVHGDGKGGGERGSKGISIWGGAESVIVVAWIMGRRRWSAGHAIEWVGKRRGWGVERWRRVLEVWEERVFGN